MSDLSDLYQEVILDHNRRPRNFGVLADANRTGQGHNPLCGDRLRLFLRIDGDRIAAISFEGSGCAISKASASLMTAAVKGKSRAEVEALFADFHGMVTGHGTGERLGALKAFSGVSRFPLRVKCASLAWHAMRSALGEGTAT